MDKKILIVEDTASLARALTIKLTKEGFSVVVEKTGPAITAALAKEKFHFIILDLVMPGFNGFEFLEDLKKKKNNIPIIVLSNVSRENDIDRAKALGVKKYFLKINTPLSDLVSFIKNFSSGQGK